MNSFPDPIWSDELKRAMKAASSFQITLDHMAAPTKAMVDAIRAVTAPQSNMLSDIQKTQKEIMRLHKSVELALGPMINLERQLDDILIAERNAEKNLSKLLSNAFTDFARLDSYFPKQDDWKEIITSYQSVWEVAKVSGNVSEIIAVGEDEVSLTEIDEQIEAVCASVANSESLGNFVSIIQHSLQGPTSPVVRLTLLMILNYFVSLLANFSAPIYEEAWHKFIGEPKTIIEKEVQASATAQYDIEILKNHRFVAWRQLQFPSATIRIPHTMAGVACRVVGSVPGISSS